MKTIRKILAIVGTLVVGWSSVPAYAVITGATPPGVAPSVIRNDGANYSFSFTTDGGTQASSNASATGVCLGMPALGLVPGLNTLSGQAGLTSMTVCAGPWVAATGSLLAGMLPLSTTSTDTNPLSAADVTSVLSMIGHGQSGFFLRTFDVGGDSQVYVHEFQFADTAVLPISSPGYSGTVSQAAGGSVAVFAGDTIGGQQVNPFNVAFSITPNQAGLTGLSLDTMMGYLVVPAGQAVSGSINVTYQVCQAITNLANCANASVALTVTPSATAPTITSAAPAAGTAGTAYTHTFTATGTTPITWSVSVGSLPAGLTLNPTTGVLSGTPSAAGTTNFTIQAANGTMPDATQAISLSITSGAVIAINTMGGTASLSLPTVSVGASSAPFNIQIFNTGTTAAVVSAVNVTGDFSVDATQCIGTLNAGAACFVFLTASPTAVGVRNGTLTVLSNASNTPVMMLTTTGTALLPLTASISFSPSSINFGGTTTVTTTVTNPNGTAINGAGFLTFLNSNLRIAPTPSAVTTCAGGMVSATPGATNNFGTTGAQIPANGSCTVSVSLIADVSTVSTQASLTVIQANEIYSNMNPTVVAALTVLPLVAPNINSPAPAAGTAGTAYTHTFTATGTTPITWSVSVGMLPAGLTLDPMTGVLSGTPSASGTTNFTIQAANGTMPNATQAVMLVVNPAPVAPTITSAAPAAGTAGTPYTHTFTATGTAPITWSVSVGMLPAGLTLDPMTGVLSGTPSASGTTNFTIQAANGTMPNATQAVMLVVNPAPVAPTITSAAPAAGTAGTPYTHTFTATGTAPITWSVSVGMLPAGLTLNPTTGVLSGTPANAATTNFTVQAANGTLPNATQAVTLVINPAAVAPTITSAAPAAGTAGAPYTHTFTATGTTPITWSVSVGSLPAGLTLNPTTGVLSGTPSAAGTTNFTIQAANGVMPSATQTVTLTINPIPVPPTITSMLPPATATIGTPYSHTYTATGVPTPTWSVISGSLPVGLILDANTGVLSGTPTNVAGSFSFVVQAVNVVSGATQSATITVSLPLVAPTITSMAPPAGAVGSMYTHPFTASGSTPITWSVSAGALPAGLTLNPTTGVLSGIPSGAGTASFTVQAANGATPNATQVVMLTIGPAPVAPTITSLAPPSATVSTPYTHPFTATGVPTTMTWTVSVGALPAGLTLNPMTGVLSGTPSAAATTNFTVQAVNGTVPAATQAVTFVVNPAPVAPTITSPAPLAGTSGLTYTHNFTASGVPTAMSWSVTSGAIPAGLTLNATTGVLTGTPTTTGTASFTVQAANGTLPNATQVVTLVINPAPLAPTFSSPSATATATVGATFTYTPSVTGTPTPTLSSAGTLPSGVTFSAVTGTLSGTPTAAGTFTVTLTATNGVGSAATQTVTITVNPAPVAPSFSVPTASVTGTVGTPLNYAPSVTGTPAPTLSSAGMLPSGVTFAATGVLSGTPTVAGTFTVTLTATNGVGSAATQTVTITVNPAPVAPSFSVPTASVTGTVGTPLNYAPSVTGTPAPTLSSAGMLPSGVTFAATGVLSGTPTVAGTFTVTLTATNGVGSAATQTVTITVNPAPVAPSFSSPTAAATATVGTPFNYTPSVTGTPAPTLSSAGMLPSGVTFAATGVLSGTPTAAGTFTVTLTATNGVGSAATQTVTITVNPAPVAPSFSVPTASVTGTVGTPLNYAPSVTGTPAPTLSSAGMLPSGVTFAATGVLSGTPTVAGTFTVTLTATNGVGSAATQTVTITVNPAPVAPSFTSQPAPATATVGTLYSHTFNVAGVPTPTLSIVGALPGWLSFNPTSRTLSGTPTVAAGPATFTIQAVNGVGSAATQTVTITVNPAPVAPSFSSPTAAATATVGTPFNYTPSVTGTPAPTLSSAGMLPSGVTFSALTGTLSGTPTAAGTFTVTLTATNGVGSAATQTVTITVNPAPVAPSFTSQPAPATATVGTLYSHTFNVAGVPTPTLSIVGALPGWLSFNPTSRTLSGTPTVAAGPATFTIQAANGVGTPATQAVSITVNPAPVAPLFTSPPAPATATVATFYTHTFTASGTPTPTLSVVGVLPPWLSFNNVTRVLSGTPTAAGTFSFTISAANGTAPNATQNITITVNPQPVVARGGVFAAPRTGGTLNIMTNDLINGQPATAANADLRLIPTPPAGFSVSLNAQLVIDPGVATGTYNVGYQLCVRGTTTCANAIAVVTLTQVTGALVVNRDTAIMPPTGGTLNVLANDSLDAQRLDQASNLAIISLVQANGVAATLSSAGVLTIPNNLAAGRAYTLTYRVCQRALPTNCADAEVTVTIIAGATVSQGSNPPSVQGTGPRVTTTTVVGSSGTPITFTTSSGGSSAGAASDPLTFSQVKLVFGESEAGKVQAFYNMQQPIEPFGAQLYFSGGGQLTYRWEIIQPGEPLPTELDLVPEASLPLGLRFEQRRYRQIERATINLLPTGRFFLKGPPTSALPRFGPGRYLILLRVEATPGPTTGTLNGAAGFAFPVLAYTLLDSPPPPQGGQVSTDPTTGQPTRQDTRVINATNVAQFVQTGELPNRVVERSLSALGANFGITPLTLMLPSAGQPVSRDRPLQFSWVDLSTPVAFYRWELSNAAGQSIFDAMIRPGISQYGPPPIIYEDLPPGAFARWRVVALDNNRRIIAASQWRAIQFR